MASILSYIIFIPLLGVLIIVLLPKSKSGLYKWIALASLALSLVLSVFLTLSFDGGFEGAISTESHLQFMEKTEWFSFSLGSFGKISVDYFLGVDGLNISLLLLAAIVLLIGVISSWNMTKQLKGYFSLYLLLSSSVLGCFVALDFFLFYLFFEFMLLPMYFLIGIWGGPRKEYAAIKFFLYTLIGSIFILIIMIGLYNSVLDPIKTGEAAGITSQGMNESTYVEMIQDLLKSEQIGSEHYVKSFNMIFMADSGNYIPGSFLSESGPAEVFGHPARWMAFMALLIGFAIKLSVFPFHTWLPDAHVEAPTPVSVVLAGVLLKIGGTVS